MQIQILPSQEINPNYSPVLADQTAEQSQATQNASSKAGWRRVRSETPAHLSISTEERLQKELRIQLEEAIKSERYEDALLLVDLVKEISTDNNLDFPGDSEISKPYVKAYLLKKLGRYEEAIHFVTTILEKLPSLCNRTKENWLEDLREKNTDPSVEIPVLNPLISDFIDQSFIKFERELLIQRGFLYLALNQKETAIDNFYKAAHCKCNDFDESSDPEFLFRVLEKVLGAQIAPTKNYEKEIATLLQKSDLSDEDYYHLAMYSALVGEHEKAIDWYYEIEWEDDFPKELYFFLIFLQGDMEAATKKLENCPNEDYKFLISYQLSKETTLGN